MSWNNDGPPPIFEGEDELALKLKWARITRNVEARFRTAGYEVFEGPENYGRAMQAYAWRHDPIVHREWERLAEVPSNEQDDEEKQRIKKALFGVMESPQSSNGDVIKAGLALAEINGYVKQGVNINNNVDNRTQNNLLVVPTQPATPEEDALVQLRIEQQQERLMKHVRERPVTVQ